MYDKELAKGSNAQITISGYRASDTLTRAEAVQFVKNILDHGEGELLSRPEAVSDKSLLSDIPMGDTPTPTPTAVPEKPNYDLPYKPPAGWIPPKIKSVATDDINKNYEILKDELGFTDGSLYNPYGINAYAGVGAVIVGSANDPYFFTLLFNYWNGSEKAPEKNKVPYVARELFKFYFPNDYAKLFKIMDDGYNNKDISQYIGKVFTLDNRKIKIVDKVTAVSILIGKSIQ
jgi:hypothetical protein